MSIMQVEMKLEIVCTPNKGTGGSNPPLSAIQTPRRLTELLKMSFFR